jgi:LacI family transcriptional regulator, galactose operon repressor
MSIREVAKRAGVSTATVSRTINRVATVDPHLAKRVWKAVDELSFYPNTQARALVSGRSRILGLIVSEITNPFFPEIVHAFEEIAVHNSYELLLTSTVHDSKRMESAVRRMIERRVDGVAILTFGMEETLIEDMRYRKIPLVFVDVGPHMPGISNIRIDYQAGIRQAVQHLAALRHTRIAFVSGPLQLKTAIARKLAFECAMREIGLEFKPEFEFEGDHTMEGGIAAFAHLSTLQPRPTAVLCSNDVTAIGVMRKAYDLGIAVPRELSVIGFDDIHLANFITPPLSTVRMSQTELAKLAFNALLKALETGEGLPTSREYTLTTSLVLRGSTALLSEHTAAQKHA